MTIIKAATSTKHDEKNVYFPLFYENRVGEKKFEMNQRTEKGKTKQKKWTCGVVDAKYECIENVASNIY